jgi:integrase/recombinase XerD
MQTLQKSQNNTIKIERTIHKGEERLLLKFEYNNALIALVKQVPGAQWSKTLNAWHVADTKENFNTIYLLFKGKAWLNWDSLKSKEKREKAPEPKRNPAEKLEPLNEDSLKKVEQYKHWLKSKRYGESTIDTYSNALKTFLRFYNQKAVSEITNEDVILFNNEYILANGFSATFQNQVVNAIKLFFSTIEKRKININEIERPKTEFRLPAVLSLDEVAKMIDLTDNLKHKTMLSIIYSGGLRRSELLNLKIKDVDSKRMLIQIRQSKGKKDRIVPLSEYVLDLLREYYKKYQPKEYLFEGQVGGKYSETSLEAIFKKAKDLAKIKKKVSLHTLRHSYATHLLEGGTNLRYIQELLGHKSPKTTQIYTHVTNDSIGKVQSPIDKLKLKKLEK